MVAEGVVGWEGGWSGFVVVVVFVVEGGRSVCDVAGDGWKDVVGRGKTAAT